MRGIVVSVNYADLLAIGLPRNMRFLDECLVITSPDDTETKSVCAGIPNVRVYETDAFFRHGAKFNKGLAMEEGFDVLGREGWILIHDADIVFPDDTGEKTKGLEIGNLYGAHRRFLLDPSEWTPDFEFSRALESRFEVGIPGFFQLFHADSPSIAKRPWYDTTFKHAGGGDGYFSARFPRRRKVRLDIHTLHLGERDVNWFGRATPRADGKPVENGKENREAMRRYMASKGWGGPKSGEVQEDRVDVPGHSPSWFELK